MDRQAVEVVACDVARVVNVANEMTRMVLTLMLVRPTDLRRTVQVVN